MLTQARLKEILHYDPETGLFARKKNLNHWKSKRRFAGSLSTEGYIRIYVVNRLYQAHNLATLYMTGALPTLDNDHINGIRDDNRWCNIREVNRSDNQKNAKRRKDNTSGLTGVNWRKGFKRWVAQIQSNKVKIHLGLYTDKFEAICARKSAELKYNFHPNHGKIL